MAREQISPAIAERRCPNCGTRVARDAESCFMCGHDLRIQTRRRQRVSWIDALLVLAVLVVLVVWWRIASRPQQEQVQDGQVAAILPTNIPLITATTTLSAVVQVDAVLTPTPLPTASAGGVIRHRVRQGETLLAIASLYGITVEEIQAANDMADVMIRADDELIIPVGEGAGQAVSSDTVASRFEYTVQPGDTIVSIAASFGSTVEEILRANGLVNNDFIRPGDLLLIPVPEVPAEVLESTASVQPAEGAAGSDPLDPGIVYMAPRLIGPPDEAEMPAGDAVLLRWVSVDVLSPNEWYVLLIYPVSGAARSLPTIWTKATSYRLDTALAPTEGENAIYAWQVSVVRVMPGVNNQFALQAASTPSELRSFTWQ